MIMNKDTVVVDANIAIKVLHSEPDTAQARAFFTFCVQHKVSILVPEHFLYEVVNVCQRLNIDVTEVLEFYHALSSLILKTVKPSKKVWLQAEHIARTGHPSSGFPSIYDSIYQAIALDVDGVFLTADHRHAAKARQHGGIMLLSEWSE